MVNLGDVGGDGWKECMGIVCAFPTQAPSALDRRRYNTASALEVAAFIPDEEAAVFRV